MGKSKAWNWNTQVLRQSGDEYLVIRVTNNYACKSRGAERKKSVIMKLKYHPEGIA